MPAMNQRDLWVLGAMPQTIGYRYNDYAFRQPVTGGPLAPFDIGGLNQLVIHSGGLSAAHSYGGGSMIQWLQRRYLKKPKRIWHFIGNRKIPIFCNPIAATMGPNQRSRCIRDPIGEKSVVVNFECALPRSDANELNGVGSSGPKTRCLF